MKLSSMIAAAAIATTPMAASAVVVSNGGTTNPVAFGDTYQFLTFVGEQFTHTFTVPSLGSGVAALSFDAIVADAFENLSITWYAGTGTGGAVLSTGTTTASTSFDTDLTQTVAVYWDSTDPNHAFTAGSVVISSVPVPAGLVLMGTALAGLGALRRRNK